MFTATYLHALLLACAWWDIGCQLQAGIASALQAAVSWILGYVGLFFQIGALYAYVWLFGGITSDTALSKTPASCGVNVDWGRHLASISPTTDWTKTPHCSFPIMSWFDQGITGGGNNGPGSFYDTLANFYGYILPVGLMVVAAAAAARIIKVAFEHRAPGQAIILDVLPRAGIGFLGVFTALPILIWLVKASGVIGVGWWQTLSGHIPTTGVIAMAAGQGIFMAIGLFILTFITGGTFLIIFILPFLVVLALFLYLLVLWVGRMIILLFCFTTAPVCIACAVYDPGNRFTKWWYGQFMSALVMPSVLMLGAGVTFLAATTVAAISPYIVGTLLSFVILIGGLWYTGKMVHGLMGDTFSHGGVMKAIEMAGAAIAFAPRMAAGAKGMFEGDSLMAKRAKSAAADKATADSTTSAPSTAPKDGKDGKDGKEGKAGRDAYARDAFSSTEAGQSYVADVNAGDLTGFSDAGVAADYAMEDMRINSPQIYENLNKELGAHQLAGHSASSPEVQATMKSYLNIARADRIGQGKAA